MSTIEARAVMRAAEICGEQALANCLDVELTQLVLWMRGEVAPPEEVFSKVAIILADHAGGFETHYRSAGPKIDERKAL